MRSFILILHIITSFITCGITLFILVRGVMGSLGRTQLKSIDVKLPLLATVFLYLQFVLGTTLYFFFMNEYAHGEVLLMVEAMANGRFWVVEHFILMVFTLVISHIGSIFAYNTKTPSILFKKNTLYFGVAFIMIVISMTMNILRHAL